jgi:hypothetical protein
MRTLLIVALAASVMSVRAGAHHSFGAVYFEDQTISIEGEVSEFRYVNPHVWVIISARDPDGVVRSFGAEWGNPARLTRQGIGKETLKPGDRVVVTGSPSRDPLEYTIHLKRIERPADGWRWAGGRDERR